MQQDENGIYKIITNKESDKVKNIKSYITNFKIIKCEIIRSKNKILSTINNAKIFKEIQKEYGSFSNYIWKFTNKKIIKNATGRIIVSSPLSDKISKDLKKRGMKYVGTVIIYSYLQAIGIINDHDKNCFKFNTN